MKVLIFGLCTLALATAAPNSLLQPNMQELSDAMLNSEEFWATHPYMASQKGSGNSDFDVITIDSSLKQVVKDLHDKATVNGYVSNGKLVLEVNSTVASVGGHKSTMIIGVENATLLTGGWLSRLGIAAKNSNIYSMSVNNTVDVVAKNCQYTDLIVNSSSKIFVTGSQLNLMLINSTIHIYAFNSQIQIANATSSVVVHAIKNSTVTYIPAPPSDYQDVAEASKFEYFRLPALHHSSNSDKAISIQQAWEKLEKMAQESAKLTN